MGTIFNIKQKNNFLDLISNHLYTFVTLFCLLLFPLGFCQYYNISNSGIILQSIIGLVFCLLFIFFFRNDKPAKTNIFLLISFTFLIIVFITMSLLLQNHIFTVLMFIPFFIGELVLLAVMIREKSSDIDYVKLIILLIISLGIVIRYCYVLFVASDYLQHDVLAYQTLHGHWGYIMYWYNNGLKIPEFNVTDYFQYYHPPLHHIIMAFMLRILTSFGMPLKIAQEAVQFLPFLYSSLSMVVCYRIFTLVRLKNIGLIVSMTIVCLHPTFIILSGSYNNDMLSVLFMLLSLLFAIKWYNKSSLTNIIPIAVFVGFGMMTKLSAWMVATPITIIFLSVLIKNIKKPIYLIVQYIIFGVICIPLGIWWSIRNFIKFDVPIAYIRDPQVVGMSVKDIPVTTRLFDFSFFQFKYPFEAFKQSGAPYNEYNPLIGLFKTSLLDETTFYLSKFTNFAITSLLLMVVLISIISFIGFCYTIISKKVDIDIPIKIAFSIFFITIMTSYYILCFKFPYVCTENIRYCIPIIPMLAMGLGFFANCFMKKLH